MSISFHTTLKWTRDATLREAGSFCLDIVLSCFIWESHGWILAALIPSFDPTSAWPKEKRLGKLFRPRPRFGHASWIVSSALWGPVFLSGPAGTGTLLVATPHIKQLTLAQAGNHVPFFRSLSFPFTSITLTKSSLTNHPSLAAWPRHGMAPLPCQTG